MSLLAPILLPVSLFAASPQVVPDLPRAEAVLDSFQESRGSESSRSKIRTVRLSGKAQFRGIEGEGVFTNVVAGKRVHIKGEFSGWGTFLQGSDGQIVWEVNSIAGAAVKRGLDADMALRTFALLDFADWKRNYTAAKSVGIEKLGDREHYRLELTPREGDKKDVWYFDRETKLVSRVDMVIKNAMDMVLEMQFSFSDWRAVDGVLYPFHREANGGMVTMIEDYEQIEHNADLPEDLFTLPKEVKQVIAKGDDAPKVPEFKIEKVEEQHVATIRVQCKPSEISRNLAVILPEVMMYLTREGIQPTGAPFSRYHSVGEIMDMEAGMPVKEPVVGTDRIKARTLPAGRVVVGWHIGPYDQLAKTHEQMGAWIEARGLESLDGQWEVYWTDPGVEPNSSKWRTQIFWPIGEDE